MDTVDEMEMEDRGAERETEREAETSFTEDRADRERDESVLIIDGTNPIFTRVDSDTNEPSPARPSTSTPGPRGKVPDPITRRQAGAVKRLMIHDKKQFLKDGLGITVNKRDGPNSTILFDKLRTTTSEKTNKINGAMYKGKKILILKDGKMQYSTARDKLSYVNEFKELLKKADKEHQKRPVSVVEKAAGVDITHESMESIVDAVSDRIESHINEITEDFTTNTELTNNELRELRGILNVKVNTGMTVETGEEKIKYLEVERDHWRDLTKKSGVSEMKSKLYDAVAKVADLKIDQIRLRVLNEKPETDEVMSMLEEESVTNDMTRFEKFKRWVRSNFTTLSLTLITVGGVITSIIMSARQAVKRGAQSVSKFGKALANLAKKAGPAIATILKVVAQLLTLGAKGLSFLSKNLWLVVLFVVYLVYNEFSRIRRSSTRTIKE